MVGKLMMNKEKKLHNPKISFVIPVYNTEVSILKKCLDSVMNLEQYFNEFEIILVDDGSKIFVREFIDIEYYKNEKLNYVWQYNQGVSAARNNGILHAKGKYIMFVDSDDIFRAENINFQELAGAWDLIIYDNVVYTKKEKLEQKIFPNKESQRLEKKLLLHEFLLSSNLYSPFGKFFRREIIIDYDLKFNKNMVMGEDAIFVLDFINKSQHFYYENSIIYEYHYSYETLINRTETYGIRLLQDYLEIYRNKIALINKIENLNKDQYLPTIEKELIDNVFNFLCDSIYLEDNNLSKGSNEIVVNNIKFEKNLKYNLIKNYNKNIFWVIMKIRIYYFKMKGII
ncbi:glycosyltransferase family 2 protein [Aerococcus urinae]